MPNVTPPVSSPPLLRCLPSLRALLHTPQTSLGFPPCTGISGRCLTRPMPPPSPHSPNDCAIDLHTGPFFPWGASTCYMPRRRTWQFILFCIDPNCKILNLPQRTLLFVHMQHPLFQNFHISTGKTAQKMKNPSMGRRKGRNLRENSRGGIPLPGRADCNGCHV